MGSKPSWQDHDADQVHEAEEIPDLALVANHQAPKALQPSKQPLDFPAPLVAARRPAVLRGWLASTGAVRHDQLDAALGARR